MISITVGERIRSTCHSLFADFCHVGGKTGQAMVVDLCPGCPPGGLDFSKGLFDYFGLESLGVLYGAWNFL